jgi:hypothetical protein
MLCSKMRFYSEEEMFVDAVGSWVKVHSLQYPR